MANSSFCRSTVGIILKGRIREDLFYRLNISDPESTVELGLREKLNLLERQVLLDTLFSGIDQKQFRMDDAMTRSKIDL